MSSLRVRLVLAAIVVFAVGLAWLIRFGCDDAFISFEYARSLVRGDGLTWFGERIEGYTNFAWVLWVAAGLRLGIAPLAWAWLGSLAALAVTLVVTYRHVRLSTDSPIAALCTVALLATNFTFLAFGTSGLETMLQCALLAGAAHEAARLRKAPTSLRHALSLSLLAAFAMWTRLDSAVVLVILGAVALRQLVIARAPLRSYVALVVPAAALVGGWLAWKLAYYGDVVPNTFHAKVGLSAATLRNGGAYVAAFLHSYLLWAALALVIAAAIVRRRVVLPLHAALVGAWFAYVIVVGGDFMEFRFFVPIMPPLYALVGETVTADMGPRKEPSRGLRALAVVALLAAVSWRHAARFRATDDHAYDSVRTLATFYGSVRDDRWAQLGQPLHDALAGSTATLACDGAGAIPYYADLPTIDQLGLNDAWVAQHGARPPAHYLRPGHQRFATYEYLRARMVTFVIGMTTVVPRGALSGPTLLPPVELWLVGLLGPTQLPRGTYLIAAAPVDEQRELLLLYLTPTPDITARIRAAGWELRTITHQ